MRRCQMINPPMWGPTLPSRGRTARGLFAICVLLLSHYAMAAPFCAVFSYGRQCWYFSYEECLRAAGREGACVVNPEEARPPRRGEGAPFCVVTSFGTQCWYYDAQSCREAARSTDGACVVNPNR